jgi:hypothetical protein
VPAMSKKIRELKVIKNDGRLLDIHTRTFMFLFTHCILCLCEWGLAAFDRTDTRVHQQYLVAAALLQDMTTLYVFPDDKSLHTVIGAEAEILAEVAWVCVLLMPPGVINPSGMRVTPLHLYRIMNSHLLDDEGTFDEAKYAYFKTDRYSVYHLEMTFAMLRAALERACLYGAIPNAKPI